MTPFMEATRLEFENMSVRLVAARKIPRIETAGLTMDEVEVGGDLTVSLWLASELMEAGLARLPNDGISGEEWTQIHYRERFQPIGRLSPLPDRFYSRVHLTFNREKRMAGADPSRLSDLSRLKGMFRDILESRISKIVRMASSEVTAQSRALQPEEVELYMSLHAIVSSWRKEMRSIGED